jgi:hypothetical protein
VSGREGAERHIPAAAPPRPWWAIGLGAAIVVLVTASPPGRHVVQSFLTSLRIPAPQRVNVNLPSISGLNANRQLLNMVSAIMTTSPRALQDEPDQPAPTADAAARLAGISVQLPLGRTDRPALSVVGAHAVALPIDRAQLRTMLTEAGRPGVPLPPTMDGATVTVHLPRAIRVQYGHCPAPPDTTLRGQLQGRPPVSSENADCIVLLETPTASVEAPAGLNVGQLVNVALELSGLSPNQAQALRRTLDWHAVLGLSLPRFVRSYDSVQVDGERGVLVTTAGRRGPTYELIWANEGIAYALAGYGSSADAVPLAMSLHQAEARP